MSDIFQLSDKTMKVKAYQQDKSKVYECRQALKDTLTGKNGIIRGAHKSKKEVHNADNPGFFRRYHSDNHAHDSLSTGR